MTAEEIEHFEKELWKRIQVLNSIIWENRAIKPKVDDWLRNFSETDERLMALYLLSEFMYFGDSQMRTLLKALYRDLYRYPIVREIRKANADTLDISIIENQFKNELLSTRFLGIGNPSESGAHLLYFFRQENNLSKKNFINSYEIFSKENKNVKELVFLDDFCGSGEQVSTDKSLADFIKSIKLTHPAARVDYLMLVGTATGIAKIRSTGLFSNVESVITLDGSFKIFGANSRYFQNVSLPFILDQVRDFARKYGYVLTDKICYKAGCVDFPERNACASSNALGFSDCQLLLGFHHNTPDNTLPIIWYDEKDYAWTPIFKRYNKKYNF